MPWRRTRAVLYNTFNVVCPPSDRVTSEPGPSKSHSRPAAVRLASSHYARLGLHPSASAVELRRAYRELSKQYHPDTTTLAPEVATLKFQQLNEAYATLSNPERRALYDVQIGYSRLPVMPALPSLRQSPSTPWRDSAYLDATDRPLSAGEIAALFALGVAFLACLLLALAVAIWRGDPLLPDSAVLVGWVASKLTMNPYDCL
ncbi:MAG: J domain-containing protein [Spirulinaceae cyanobacterium RM2_2_10]|nr:J domain-containing protein [Spirulinaceae cyanobacterium SM2_1_0]NJO21199.1 J domain-containing protein [Spirulinaceae cyanobacterium RM2_2_10]